MSPPGALATTEAVPASESERCESVPDLSTQEARRNYLVDVLGITPTQAHHKLRRYAAHLSDAQRLGNDTGRSDADFLAWLMAQAPGGRRRSVCKRDWRVTS